jgi:hypothetical protein
MLGDIYMGDKVLDAFLKRQYEEGNALDADSDILDLRPLDGPAPRRYVAIFNAKGLIKSGSDIVEADRFAVGIRFPTDYLRHVDVGQVLTYLGPHPEPWHPNIHSRAGVICVHIQPGTGLVELLYNCYEMWTWNLYATGDEGLNHAASQWARSQDPSRFPIDTRPLKRRQLRLTVEPVHHQSREE